MSRDAVAHRPGDEQEPGASVRFLDGIWAAVPTPFRPDGELDLDGVRSNVRHFTRALGLDGIFCNGLMGEGWSLTPAERKAILEAALEDGRPPFRVGVVTTDHSLAGTIDLSRHAAHAGADHAVLMRPGGPFTAHELGDYVRAVRDAADIPIVLFDSEAQSGGFPRDLILRLANEGCISAVKCTRDADAIEGLRAHCGHRVAVADPYESHWLANLVRFDLRALYADPEPYLFQTPTVRHIADYRDAHARGEFHRAVELSRRLEPLRRVYHRWILEPLFRGAPMNAALKHWAARMGLATGPVRRPLRGLTRTQAAALDAELDAAFAEVFADGDPRPAPGGQ